jgi:hypothetical protein
MVVVEVMTLIPCPLRKDCSVKRQSRRDVLVGGRQCGGWNQVCVEEGMDGSIPRRPGSKHSWALEE